MSAHPLLIGAELVPGAGPELAVENPYTEQTVATIATASAEQTDAAIAAAREAWSGWATTPAGERGEMLHEVGRRLRERSGELAALMTAEGGKPLIENSDEVEWCAAAFDYYAEIGRDSAGRVIPPIGSSQLALVVKDPLGVIGCTAFLNAGQVCTSAERFYVMEEIYDDYVNAFVDHAATLVLGDPMQSSTDIGPMVSAPQRDKVVAQVEAAVGAGAELLAGGTETGQERGHFYAPAVLTGVAAETDLLREETFGPVAPIVPVKSLDEAIELANGTRFGLGANVYTRDLKTAVRCMRELRAGTVWINDPLTDNDAGPFGGFKQSGIGRELGREGLEAFQETKHVHMETEIERKEWWYPYSEYAGGG